jgi:hypothetical protein
MAASVQWLSHVLQHWMASDSGGPAAQVVVQVSRTPEGKGLCTLLTKASPNLPPVQGAGALGPAELPVHTGCSAGN